MAKRYNQFEECKKYLYNKDIYLNNFIDDMLTRCYSMFEYKNLPNGIEKENIERYLMINGNCIFTKVNDDFYVLDGSFTGLENAYHKLHEYLVNNVALNLNATFETEKEKDCVLIENNSERKSFLDIFSKYGVMLNDCEISLNMLAILNRLPYLITSADERTKSNVELFLSKIKNGDFSIIMDNAFIESIKSIPLNQQSNNQIQSLIELTQYIKASSFNAIGLNANWNSKRERLNSIEINLNEDSLTPLIDNMIYCRKKAVEKINAKYGLNISVDLANIWEQKAQEIKTELADLKDDEKTNDTTKELNNVDKSGDNVENLENIEKGDKE